MFRRPQQSRTALRHRRGAQVVEVAACMPIFITILFGLFECGHVMMVVHTMNASAQNSARYGATSGITSAQVVTYATNQIRGAIKPTANPTVLVKDGSVFETPNVNPSSVNYTSLSNIELSTATTDQLYVVRVTLPYDTVSLLPTRWVKNKTLVGQAVLRHE